VEHSSLGLGDDGSSSVWMVAELVR